MPGGLLDMFGIDPVANRQKRDRASELDKTIAGELARTKLANQGQLDVTNAQGKNSMTLEQWKALAEHAKTLGISPDTIAELKPKRMEIDAKTLDTRKTNTDVADTQARQRGSMYGVNSPVVGLNPDIAEGLRRSTVAEAVNPAMAMAKANSFDIARPQLRQDTVNPLSFGVTPFINESKTEGYFDTKTGQMVPGQSAQSLTPGMPVPDAYQLQRAEREEAAAMEAEQAAKLSNPMYGRGMGVLAPPGMPPQMQQAALPQVPQQPSKANFISTLLDAIRREQQKQRPPTQPLFPGRVGGY
jgi:hypothetical protein